MVFAASFCHGALTSGILQKASRVAVAGQEGSSLPIEGDELARAQPLTLIRSDSVGEVAPGFEDS